MLFAQGLGLLFDWLVAPYRRLARAEWGIVLVIAVTMALAGLLEVVSAALVTMTWVVGAYGYLASLNH